MPITLDSALTWLPRISPLGLPIPRTRIVIYDHKAVVELVEEHRSGEYLDSLVNMVGVSIDIVGLPVFLRTDLCSAKHEGPSAYKIENRDGIQQAILRTVEDAELKFWPHAYPRALLVREWIEIDYCFLAFRGHPIGYEWRYFADALGVRCHHYYWPSEAMRFRGEQPQGWEQSLRTMSQGFLSMDLGEMAVKAAGALQSLNNEWSVDFARDTSGKWWLIDMATAERSYHEYECDRRRASADQQDPS